MNFRRDKFVRFKNWSAERSSSFDSQFYTGDGQYPTKARLSSVVLDSIRRGFERGSEWIKSLRKPEKFHSEGSRATKEWILRKNIIDPQSSFLQKWNKVFIFSCLIALSLDPLFFYIPVIDGTKKCLKLDKNLEVVVCVLRTFNDMFHLLHIIFEFGTAYIAPSSRVFGRGELVDDPVAIAKKYLSSYFIIDVLAILPLPQLLVLVIIPEVKGSVSLVTKELLKVVIFSQYVPRVLRIIPIYKQVTRTSGILTNKAWLGAAFNLFCYMLASHVVGALWYLFAIEREDKCWLDACSGTPQCDSSILYCGANSRTEANTFVFPTCQPLQPNEIKNSTVFNFGIFYDALDSGVLESTVFQRKFFYCFWWGLRNLSSLGQNLKTSTFVGEILFAVFISIFGLVLFSSLIGNMQKYLQSTSVRIEEMRVKRQDAEQWMSHRMLPKDLRDRIRRYDQYRWQETRGVEEETLIRNLPKDLRRDIKRHLCLALLKRVPVFEKMDEQLMDALCNRLKPVLYTEMSFIVREGDPVDAMLFIMRGTLVTVTTNGGRSNFFNSVHLKAGDFCGEELLTWALDSHSSINLPISTRTVKASTEVEAFALMADDLKFVASQFRRLHSKQFQQTFRFYSLQWRTWAACFIQAAWRRYCRRVLDKSLHEAEARLQAALAKNAKSSPGLVATVYASRFAANALRNLQQSVTQRIRLQNRLPSLRPPKPIEPDFSSNDHTEM